MNFTTKRASLIFFIGILVPELLTDFYNQTHHNDFRFTLQYITGVIILICSIFLLVISSRGVISSTGKERISKVVFVILSILSLGYISIALFMQYALQNIQIG